MEQNLELENSQSQAPASIEEALASVEEALENVREALGSSTKGLDSTELQDQVISTENEAKDSITTNGEQSVDDALIAATDAVVGHKTGDEVETSDQVGPIETTSQEGEASGQAQTEEEIKEAVSHGDDKVAQGFAELKEGSQEVPEGDVEDDHEGAVDAPEPSAEKDKTGDEDQKDVQTHESAVPESATAEEQSKEEVQTSDNPEVAHSGAEENPEVKTEEEVFSTEDDQHEAETEATQHDDQKSVSLEDGVQSVVDNATVEKDEKPTDEPAETSEEEAVSQMSANAPTDVDKAVDTVTEQPPEGDLNVEHAAEPIQETIVVPHEVVQSTESQQVSQSDGDEKPTAGSDDTTEQNVEIISENVPEKLTAGNTGNLQSEEEVESTQVTDLEGTQPENCEETSHSDDSDPKPTIDNKLPEDQEPETIDPKQVSANSVVDEKESTQITEDLPAENIVEKAVEVKLSESVETESTPASKDDAAPVVSADSEHVLGCYVKDSTETGTDISPEDARPADMKELKQEAALTDVEDTKENGTVLPKEPEIASVPEKEKDIETPALSAQVDTKENEAVLPKDSEVASVPEKEKKIDMPALPAEVKKTDAEEMAVKKAEKSELSTKADVKRDVIVESAPKTAETTKATSQWKCCIS